MFLWVLLACAVKDGAEVLRIQNAYREHVKEIPAKELSFEQSMAKLYMQKSWEEYSNSQYQDAVSLANKSEEWLKKSIEKQNPPSEESADPVDEAPKTEEIPPSATETPSENQQDASK